VIIDIFRFWFLLLVTAFWYQWMVHRVIFWFRRTENLITVFLKSEPVKFGSNVRVFTNPFNFGAWAFLLSILLWCFVGYLNRRATDTPRFSLLGSKENTFIVLFMIHSEGLHHPQKPFLHLSLHGFRLLVATKRAFLALVPIVA
jgi:hypothetical protein